MLVDLKNENKIQFLSPENPCRAKMDGGFVE